MAWQHRLQGGGYTNRDLIVADDHAQADVSFGAQYGSGLGIVQREDGTVRERSETRRLERPVSLFFAQDGDLYATVVRRQIDAASSGYCDKHVGVST